MKLLKNSIYIFKMDIKRIIKNPLTLIIIIGLMIIPSLYAWFNIEALWDPYSNASNLPIGVYSADIGTNIQGNFLNIGQEISDTLEKDTQLDWQIATSKDELTQNVQNGTYYGSIYIPKDFSQKLTSIINGSFEKPTIEYSVNEKINAISPKMTEAGAEGLSLSITQGFNKVVSEVVLTTFKDLGIEINKNIPLFYKFFEKVNNLDEKVNNFDYFLNNVSSLDYSLNNYSLDTITNKVDDLQTTIHTLNIKVSALLNSKDVISKLNQNSKSLTDFKIFIDSLDKKIDNISKNIDSFSTKLDSLNNKIDIFASVLEDLKNEDLLTILEDFQIKISDIEVFLDDILYILDSGFYLLEIISINISSIANDIILFLTNTTLSPSDIANIISILTNLNTNLSNINNLINNILTILIPINIATGGTFNSTISILQTLTNKISTLQIDIDYVIANINTLSTQGIIDSLTNIKNQANNIVDLINNLDFASLSQNLDSVFNTIFNGIESGSLLIENLNYTTLDGIQNALNNLTTSSSTIMFNIQNNLPNIKIHLDNLNTFLQNNTDDLISFISNLDSFWNDKLPNIAISINNIDNFMQNNLYEINDILYSINNQIPNISNIIDNINNFYNNKWTDIKNFIHLSNDFINNIKNNETLKSVINYLITDVQKGSDFIANPVEVKTIRMYPVKNYGSASAPFYTTLCLWVGAVLLTSILSTHFYNDSNKKLSNRAIYLGRLYTFLFIAIIQALIVAIGNIYLLKISVISPIWFIVFTVAIAISFNCIVYTLANLFGNVGKALAIVGLVLSISAGGGNFPIEVSGKFFQIINPFLPFTHGVNLLREPIGGIYFNTVYVSLLILVLYALLFLLLGLFGAHYINPILKKLEEKSRQSHIFH